MDIKLVASLVIGVICLAATADSGLTSLDTGRYTIMKVRSATESGKRRIIASSYHGTVLCMGYDGKILWENKLSGFMNHDVWCADITGDKNDEILTANADGSIYCIDGNGKRMWSFRANSAPMYSVCVVRKAGVPYVACGGTDKNLYYLTAVGKLVTRIHSKTYSKEKTWGKGPKRTPPKGIHTINFVRPINIAGKEMLALHGVINTNAASGGLYLFTPLAKKPGMVVTRASNGPAGDMRVVDRFGDGHVEILFGSSSMIHDAGLAIVDPVSGKKTSFLLGKERTLVRKLDRFGYRVMQSQIIEDVGRRKVLLLFGSRILLLAPNMKPETAEVLACKYSFNDMWKDPDGRIILASSQSGGSCVHVINPAKHGWKQEYQKLAPPGKIAAILKNTETVKEQLTRFAKPSWEKLGATVYFMTDGIPESKRDLVDWIDKNCTSPVFLKGRFLPKVEEWDRSGLPSKKYRDKRDRRKKYVLTSDQVLAQLTPLLNDNPGISYWGGHGTDPFQISLKTEKRIVDAAKGKKVVIIYPELEDPSPEFATVMNYLIYPLAKHCQGRNANIYIRCKHLFWQSSIYEPMWSRLMSGEFADVFVPSMEETTDKSMELSLAARMGIWASGAVDNWGGRCARDNPSYDRLRQYSHQMLPNHFLRYQVYNIASGATYMNNFGVDQEYMSVLWELIAKGALYVPKRNEIVSFSPVHIGMTHPDKDVADDGNNVKWTLFYDEEFEKNNKRVFSRLNGSWPGAPVTKWDFSRYAAGVNERRLNFLPPYPNGLVLIAPKQAGRKRTLKDNLHPLYRNILREHVTDGRYYYSKDGKKLTADTYYKAVEQDIIAAAKKIPITVSGNVAWVAAATSSKHIRLTLVDSGYINPGDKTATITFNTVTPMRVTDVLSKQRITVNGKTAKADVPCGIFRFLDVEIREPL